MSALRSAGWAVCGGLGALALVGVSCQTGAKPAGHKLLAPREAPPATAQEAFEQARAHGERVVRLDAVMVAHGWAGLGALGVTLDVLAQRPAHLYVAARGFLGPPVDELWTNGDTFLWRSSRPGVQGARGAVTPESLAAMLGLSLPPAVWVGLLAGVPLPAGPPQLLESCKQENGTRCVKAKYDSGSVTLWVAHAGVVTAAEFEHQGTLGWVKYSAWERRWEIPTRLELGTVRGKVAVRLMVTPLAVNGPPPLPALFAPLEGAVDTKGVSPK